MPVVRFIGRAVPTVLNMTIGPMPSGIWPIPEIGLDIEFKCFIRHGVIHVECSTNRYTPEDFVHLLKVATDISQLTLDLIAFRSGFPTVAVLETFINEHGVPDPIINSNPQLTSIATALSLTDNNEFQNVFKILAEDWRAMCTLRDLIRAISSHHEAPINHGRTIEGIRNLMAPTLGRNQAWEVVRNNLNVADSYLRFITDKAIAPRHGDRGYLDGTTTGELATRTWTIMNRYIEFRKRGDKQLPKNEFPILS